MHSTGHTAMHGASEQCMQATEMLFSPGTPSLSVTTRRRFTPQGTSCSCLQAVTHPLLSMHPPASQMNFFLAMSGSSDLRPTPPVPPPPFRPDPVEAPPRPPRPL